ncbi:cytochrome o ubiquinol oxidase subunit IV [Candidatus Liberibacter africanus]|uniref:Cytochrome bo(3) ubiquinol oxidase subunit 4 n=1 Tax=Candidatus Liberibacter africanus PTSAPSY TaxID=1277257 RepID=A0A0G3I6N4_LIBAF|nr:cytochrome o ubiquinol oxidase subunit IV [Candidatus Liberibacter africanus]AKK20183.1 cytochrome o ubiquinol oxidase subunit IV [Candidatus Liberibacter africanus PTSAPSY]
MHHFGTRKQCLTGFVLSLMLTAIPFGIVKNVLSVDKNMIFLIIVLCALAQIIVQLVFFLHMNTKLEDGWNVMAMIFTIIIVAICFIGSIWVMYHLNSNMMPMGDDMRSIHQQRNG